MNRQQNRRSFERLESRQLMAGNVTAAVTGGNLTITGDGTGNAITVQEVGTTGKWEIITHQPNRFNKVLDKTVTDEVTGSMTINLGSGNDNLTVQGGSIPGHLTILMGDGNDVTTLANLQIGTFLHFEGNAGNDRLNVQNVAVTDPTFAFFSTIDMQDGNDTATINNLQDQDLELTMGAGNDHLNMANCQFVGGPFQRLRIDTGAGNDTATLSHTSTGPLTLNVGTGNNALKVTKCTADTADLENSGTGSLAGSGNEFASETLGSGFSKLLGQFNT